MSTSMTDAARLFRFNTSAAEARLRDLPDEAWARQLGEASTPRWILGHMCIYRRNILRKGGHDLPIVDWEAKFAKGTMPADYPANIAPSVLIDDFIATGEPLSAMLESLSDDALATPFGRTLPDGSDTLGKAIMFLLWHETYHMGQLGILHKAIATS